MCQNLGATTGIDPFSPQAGNHGAKYQWGANTGETGRYYSQANDQFNPNAIAGWNSSGKPNGSWSDASKTLNDPCPTGYRVPTSAQWQAVIANNSVERVGSWNYGPGNYDSALYFKHPSGVRTLMLPAAGYRFYTDGTLYSRNSNGEYWSSSEDSSSGLSYFLEFGSASSGVITAEQLYVRTNGMSVRCIAQ
ncbi:hypothetical protein ACH34I_04540 [Elizabethkingia anophelis]